MSTIVTLSGSHVIAGAAVAMSSLGSAVGIAMMVGGRGAPLLGVVADGDRRCAPHVRVSSGITVLINDR